jgi:hypothetical protein
MGYNSLEIIERAIEEKVASNNEISYQRESNGQPGSRQSKHLIND